MMEEEEKKTGEEKWSKTGEEKTEENHMNE